jgi:uncharacterized C2H2 Zn-finger protein
MSFECSRCARSFASSGALNQHAAASHPQSFSCPSCEREFRSDHALHQHSRDSHPPAFSCARCAREFNTESARDQHQRDAHRAVRYECPQASCGRLFNSEQARDQHERDAHALFYCNRCNRAFRTVHARDQHSRDAHRNDIDDDDSDEEEEEEDDFEDEEEEEDDDSDDGWLPNPPVSTPGYWTLREDFLGRKSFGFYICDCGKRWGSAHSFPKYKQGCQACEEECYPHWLWVNTFPRDPQEPKPDSASPHDRSRCEACQHGQCLAGKDYDSD